MRAIITADLHLTDRPADAYRFEFFDWLYAKDFDALVLLGDLTDEKDRHSALFVDRIVNSLLRFVAGGREVHLLMGNHDYTDATCPFFKFLGHLPNCFYYATPQIREIGNTRWSFYPHSREPKKYWADMRRGRELGVDYTLCHQIFQGAQSESGHDLDGCEVPSLEGAGKIFAGDVHTPQEVGLVEYVGAPYPVRFGDSFEPHVVLVEDAKTWTYLKPPHIQKVVLEVSDPDDIEYTSTWNRYDQVKVVLKLSRADFGRWEKYCKRVHRICEKNDLVLCGIELRERVRERLGGAASKIVPVSPTDQFDAYCRHACVDNESVAAAGRELLEV